MKSIYETTEVEMLQLYLDGAENDIAIYDEQIEESKKYIASLMEKHREEINRAMENLNHRYEMKAKAMVSYNNYLHRMIKINPDYCDGKYKMNEASLKGEQNA